MKILGYMTVYIRVETKELEQSYFKMSSDFRKPITRRILRGLLKGTRKTAVSMGLTPTKVCFATEEEYKTSEAETVWEDEWHESEAEE